MKVAIIVGHDKTSPGAYSPHLGMSEYLYNSEVATYLACRFDVYTRPIGGGYQTQMRKLAEQINSKNYDLVIELHFNNFDNKANGIGEGVETLSYPGNKWARELGQKYCDLISKAYGTKNRGAKEAVKNGRGWGFISKMKAPAIIVEPFFGDELESMKFKNPGKYAEVIHKWLCD